MAFMKWAASAAAVAGMVALVSGCGGGGSSSGSNAEIRLLNATTGFAALDLKVDDKAVNTGVAYASAGTFTSVSTTGAAVIQSSSTTISTRTLALDGGGKYTMIAYGRTSPLPNAIMLKEGQAATPATGNTSLLVLNAAPEAGAVNVYLTPACTDSLDAVAAFSAPIAAGNGSGYGTITAGTYCIRVTGPTDKNDLRLTLSGVSLPSLQISALILTPTSGGLLVNGMLLVEGGSVTNYVGSSARVRVIAGVPGGPAVTVARGGTTLLAGAPSPTIEDYKTVVAGNSTISVTVAGASAPVTVTPDLTNGGDYTLLVSGTIASPQVAVITDDNRPTADGQVKLRLINGLANLPGGLTFKADLSTVASGVLPGTASAYATLTPGASTPLTVQPPGTLAYIYQSTETLTTPGVWDLILLGDGSSKATVEYSLRKVR